MIINKNIDFSNITVSKVFHNSSKQYALLNNLSESNWNKYVTEMLNKKVRIKYDAKNDLYTATPLKENQMTNKKVLLQDEDDNVTMDDDVLNIINSIDSDETEPEVEDIVPDMDMDIDSEMVAPEEEVVDETPATSSLAQLQQLLSQVLSDINGTTTQSVENNLPENEIPENGVNQHENVLDSEFEVNGPNLDYIDSKIDAGSYMGTIDPTYNQKEVGLKDDGDNEIHGASVDDFSDNDIDIAPSVSASNIEELDEEEESFASNPSGVQEYNDYMTEDDEIGAIEDDVEEQEPVTAQGTANFAGSPVKIVLTGVMITPGEIEYVAESAKKEGLKLKEVKGVQKIVHFVVEGNNKTYNITYEDVPSFKTKTPFSIKQYKFQTLDEAFEKINSVKKNAIKEAKNFKKFMNKDIANRSITNIKESNILKEFDGKISKDYIAGWNVKSVGFLNLKTGLNEVYSNITEHSKEPNTLVKTKDGQFYLLKGNLKERSEVGTKKQLVDLDFKKDFGVATVVGVYENSVKGLGQIMYKVKRTSIPLLTWK